MPKPKPDKNKLIEEYITKFGYKIVDDGEINGKWNVCSQIKVQCHHNENHVFTTCITNLKNNKLDISSDCPHCKKEKRNKELGIHKSIIEEYCEKYNLEYYPRKEYYNRWEDSITFVCKEDGFKKKIKSLFHWEKNIKPFKCDTCENNKLVKNKENFEVIKNAVNEKHKNNSYINLPETIFNYELSSSIRNKLNAEETTWHILEYNGTRNKSKVKCKKCGIKKDTLISNIFGKGRNCLNCRKKQQKFSVEDKIIQICEDNDLSLYDKDFKYVDVYHKINMVCNKCGNEIQKSWAEITGCYYKITCNKCGKKYNKENEIVEFIKEIGIKNILCNNRELIKPLEIDILVEDSKLGIEFCGNVWHSTKYNRDTSYHKNKMKMCEEKGYQLITIFEDEWDDKKEICKNIIRNKLMCDSKKVFARKCYIQEINDKNVINDFLEYNHIQGKCNFEWCYGLYYENELIEIMTLIKSRNSQEHDYEINRLSSKIGYCIVGGASKLLSHIKKKFKGKISSFADLRYSTGNVYEKMGFKLDYEIRPRYSYVGNETKWKRKHRFNYNKNRLIQKYGENIKKLSEKEITEINGLWRLYDCGYKKYSIVV